MKNRFQRALIAVAALAALGTHLAAQARPDQVDADLLRTDLRYVTTATGRDYRDVAPTSGTYRGEGARATLTVRKSIRLAELA